MMNLGGYEVDKLINSNYRGHWMNASKYKINSTIKLWPIISVFAFTFIFENKSVFY